MASVIKRKDSKYWAARFTDWRGRERQMSTKTTDRSRALEIAEEYERRESTRGQREASIIAVILVIGGFATLMLAGPQYDHTDRFSYLRSSKLALSATLAVLYGTMALTARLTTTLTAPSDRYTKAREMGRVKYAAFLLACFILMVLGLAFMVGLGFLSLLIVPLGEGFGFIRYVLIGAVCGAAVASLMWLLPRPLKNSIEEALSSGGRTGAAGGGGFDGGGIGGGAGGGGGGGAGGGGGGAG